MVLYKTPKNQHFFLVSKDGESLLRALGSFCTRRAEAPGGLPPHPRWLRSALRLGEAQPHAPDRAAREGARGLGAGGAGGAGGFKGLGSIND